MTENQICYWLIVGIAIGAGIMAVLGGRYISDITYKNKALTKHNSHLKRRNARMLTYINTKSRNIISLGD